MAISLPEETKNELITSIQQYFLDERDEEVGQLQASFLLDFVLEQIGPSIYNRAISDAQSHLQRIVTDLDVTLNEIELPLKR